MLGFDLPERDTVPVRIRPHNVMMVETQAGSEIKVTPCMLVRLDADEIVEGRVPNTMPEYNEPVGSHCHDGWRGGCPE